MAERLLHSCGLRVKLALLAFVFLLGLTACSPGGAPSGTSPAANYSGYWVWTDGFSLFDNRSYFKLSQSGASVTGQFYITNSILISLRRADTVSKCGSLSGNVKGKTLSLRVDLTPQNCPELDLSGGFNTTGQLRDDNTFVGSLVGDGGGISRRDSVTWESVSASDPRVDFDTD